MTAVLVSISDAKAHLRATSTADDALIQGIVDSTESLFLRSSGRGDRPFATAATGVLEHHDGTATPMLMLNYPIASITSITIGRDPASPDETLDPTDVNVVTFSTGSRALWRTDGGVWRARGDLASRDMPGSGNGSWGWGNNEPRIVHVTYSHDADLPDFPKLAIERAVAAIYRQIGSEDAKSETLSDNYQRTVAEVATGDAVWNLAVDAAYEPTAI